MKKLFLLSAVWCSAAISIAQTPKTNLEPVPLPAISSTSASSAYKSPGATTTGAITVTPSGPSGLPSGAATTAPSGVTALPSSDFDHFCPTHKLTKAHYESMGMTWEDYLHHQEVGIAQSKLHKTGGPGLKTPGTNTIAVIFHVVHANTDPLGTGTNVSNALIMNVFNDLVEDFSLTNADQVNARSAFGFVPDNPGINFCLATQTAAGVPLTEIGVIRVPTTEDWYDSDGGEENEMKASATGGSQIWDRNKYLNVWICDISNGASSGTAGYAYKPTSTLLPSSAIDGIVLDYNLGVNNDNVLTHEVGHYLGLDHTWGGSGGCTLDDGFADTPQNAGPSFNYSGSCSGFQQTCPAIQTQYENYMDYANCTCMFTTEQCDYMLLILTTLRSSLMLSAGCNPTATPPVSAFSSIPYGPSPVIISEGAAVNFIDESTNVPTGWSWAISGTAGVDWVYTSGTTSTTQNPVVMFNNPGFYNVTLTASNVYGVDATPADSIAYIQVVTAPSGIGCDTVRDYNPATEGIAAYILDDVFGPPWEDWGYFPGHGGYDFNATVGLGLMPLTRWAEKYSYAGTAEVRRLRIPIYEATDLGAAGQIRYTVNLDNAGGSVPGTQLVEDTILIADLFAGYWNELDFSNPASVTGNFWITFEFDYGAGPASQDTVILGCVNFGDRDATTGINDLIVERNSVWYQVTTLWGGYETSLYMDVLLSNGPDPSANFTFTDSEVCPGGQITVNGSSSTNVTDYFWNQWDPSPGTSLATSTAPATTFTFAVAAGAYEIYLFADGSCMTSGVYLPVTVNPAITFGVSVVNTTCGYNNGSITVTGPTGGDGVYEYSLDGSTWVSTPSFTGLPAGTYTVYVHTDGDNCDAQTNVTINASTAFVAGISPNATICPGDNTTISASGGTLYSWYDGATVIGSTASVNVTPVVTTTYSCIVTNGAGCLSNVSVTVTVDPPDDASFNFYDFCFGAANAAVDIVTPGGTFSFFDDPTGTAVINPVTGEISSETLGATYIVQYDVNVNCPGTSTTSVTVNTNDDPSFVTGDFCDGDVNTVSGIATPGGTFSYDGSDGSSIDAVTGVITGGMVSTTYLITYDTPPGICNSSSSIAVTVQPIPAISSSFVTDPLCNGDATGSIDLTVSGISPTYDWGASGTTEDLSGLVAGTYDVIVTDGICQTTGSYTLIEPPALLIDSVLTTDVLCFGESTGTVDPYFSGGTPGYTFDVGGFDPTALAQGLYTLSAMDANGCIETQSFVINEPPAMDASGVTTMDDGTSNGSVDLTPSGGVAPYTFDWDNGATTEDISGLAAGDYTVTITDANGCVFIITFTVTSSAGTDNPQISDVISIYPNPTNGQFVIELSGSFEARITDSRGRLILMKTGNDQLEIDLSHCESAVYFVHVEKENVSFVTRVVVH